MPTGDCLLSAVEHRTRDRSKPSIVKRAKDENGQQDHWMYQLKRLRYREPLNLKRIPPLLLADIFSRQTGQTMMNLSQISYKWYLIISQILAKIKQFIAFEKVLRRFKWTQLVDFDHASNYKNSLGNKRTFRDWIDFLLPMIDYTKLSKLDCKMAAELLAIYDRKGEHDLKKFDLFSLSSALVSSIVNRMSFLAVIRLRQASSLSCSQVDSALIQYYPASVMFGQLDSEIAVFQRHWRLFQAGPTINGNCRSIIDSTISWLALIPEPSSSFIREYKKISPRLLELTSITRNRDDVDKYRWKEEWEHLGSIPPTRSIPLQWDHRQLYGPYWA